MIAYSNMHMNMKEKLKLNTFMDVYMNNYVNATTKCICICTCIYIVHLNLHIYMCLYTSMCMRVSMRVCENMNMKTNPPNWVGARGRFLTIYPKQRHFAFRFWQTELQGHTLVRVACQPNFENTYFRWPNLSGI